MRWRRGEEVGSDAGRSKLRQIDTWRWPVGHLLVLQAYVCFLLTRCRRLKHIAASLRINIALMWFNETSSWWFCSGLQNTCGQRELFRLRKSSPLLIIWCKCQGHGEGTGCQTQQKQLWGQTRRNKQMRGHTKWREHQIPWRLLNFVHVISLLSILHQYFLQFLLNNKHDA